MIICSSGYNLHSTVHQSLTECLCIFDDLFLIFCEFRLQGFFEAYRFSCDHVFQWSSLDSREYSFIKVEFICCFLITEDQTASWSAQCLMCRRCCDICVRDRAWMKSCCNKSCDMGHINHQVCSYFIRDLTEFFEINDSCISTCSRNDHLWFFFYCDLTYLIIIDHTLVVHSV